MGKYHPHGDSAIYDTIVRMAQTFSMREPLVDGQGNFGSVDGDAAAAMRYTEIRLTRLAEDLIGDDIDKETVDWTLTYDGSLQEPVVLPSAFPNLLVNGSEGIAVGMATKIPPHNLARGLRRGGAPPRRAEDRPRRAPRRSCRAPTSRPAASSSAARGSWTRTARGAASSRCAARPRSRRTEKGDRESIVITEIPFQVNKARLIELIAHLVNEKRLEGISAIRDESDREGMRDRRGRQARRRRAGRPEPAPRAHARSSPRSGSSSSRSWTGSRASSRSRTSSATSSTTAGRSSSAARSSTSRKAEERAHILLGLALALANLDRVIAIIRGSKDAAEAKERLTAEIAVEKAALEKFLGVDALEISASARTEDGLLRLDAVQAQAILDMRLQRLTGLEREKILAEYREVLAAHRRPEGHPREARARRGRSSAPSSSP